MTRNMLKEAYDNKNPLVSDYDFDLKNILSKTDYSLRKSKIVCTIGPACWSVEQLCDLLEAGIFIISRYERRSFKLFSW